MKTIFPHSLIGLALLVLPLAVGAEQSSSASASAPEHQLPTYSVEDVFSIPRSVRCRVPKVKPHLIGTTLELKFTVTAKGRAENIRLVKPLASYSNVEKMTFASKMLDLVRYWRFEPARDLDDNPLTVNVIMPVRVVKYGKSPKAFASLELDTSHVDRS